jgi:hypothetical protein
MARLSPPMTDSPRTDSAGNAETRPGSALRRDAGDAAWHNDLAGASGRVLWLLLERWADLPWLKGRSDSPCYTTATLWQAGPTGWPALTARVTAALAERA